MRPRRILAVVVLLVLAPLAGCFGAAEIPAERSFSASGGKASPGWAYDGAGVTAANAVLQGLANNPDNTGNVTATFEYAGSAWSVTFDQFAQASGKDFQDGGVVFELSEHGDTGVSDASIPAILAKVAIWGSATVTRDGAPVTGVAGGLWSAHLMLSDTTVRASDGRILNAAGSAPYAPSAPGDAQRVEGDPQAFLVLKSPDGEDAVRQPVAQTSPLVCTGPDCQQSVEVPVEQGAARLDVVVNFTGANGAPAPLGQVTVNLVDPAGTVVDSGNVQATPNAPGSVALGVDEPVPGTWLVQVNGAGVYTASVDSVAAYDDHPFIVLTWDDVTLV